MGRSRRFDVSGPPLTRAAYRGRWTLSADPREHFWNIDQVALFYALSIVAAVVLAWGLARLTARWRRGWTLSATARPAEPPPSGARGWAADVLLNAGVFRADLAGGAAHLLALWGFVVLFIGTCLLTIDHYVIHFLTGTTWLVYSLLLDLFGLGFVLGLTWLVARRYLLRTAQMHHDEPHDAGLLLLLLAIAVTGFLVEGVRFAVVRPASGDWSPVGLLLARVVPVGSREAHRAVWWLHAALSLLLVAWLPWGKLRHAITSPYHRFRAARSPVLRSADEREQASAAYGAHELLAVDTCMWCNRCETACPSNAVGERLSPRQVVADLRRASADGASRPEASPAEIPWLCTSCGACRHACPVSIDGRDLIRETRALLVEDGTNVPDTLARALDSMSKNGNPWGGARSRRGSWAEGLGLRDLSRGDRAPTLWLVGCTLAYDTRCQRVAQAAARVLTAFDVEFAIAGKRESCSGDLARRCGEDGLFEMMMVANAELFTQSGVAELIVSSPHDLYALTNEYPRLAPRLDGVRAAIPPAAHVTELLAERIGAGALRFADRPARRVTFHDPCYLGRMRGAYDAPRALLRAIPGVSLVEMADHGADSWCCGGGGGRMWFEPDEATEKMSVRRLRQAEATGAEVIATACPYCLIQFEDAAKTAGLEGKLRVADDVELAAEALTL